MQSTKTDIEASGESVEAAIQDALGRLGATREDVDVKVIDEGKKGFLGVFGGRRARVFVSLKKARRPAAGRDGGDRDGARGERGRGRERGPDGRERGQGGRERGQGGPERGGAPGARDTRREPPRRAAGGAEARDGDGASRRPDGARGERNRGSRPPRSDRVERDDRGERGERGERGGRRDGRTGHGDRVDARGVDPMSTVDLVAASAKAATITKTILDKMGFDSTVEGSVDDGQIRVNVDCNDREGLLIGRKGETLQALQHVVTRVTSREMKERMSVTVDISGYRERRTEALHERAVEMGQEAIKTGREIKTEPMVAGDRRIVHRALADTLGVETQAIGNGSLKRILIRPTGEIEATEPDRAPRFERMDNDRDDRDDRRERSPRGDGYSRGGRGDRGGRDRGDRGDRRPPRGDSRGRGRDDYRGDSGGHEDRPPRDARSDAGTPDDGRKYVLAEEPLDMLGLGGGAAAPSTGQDRNEASDSTASDAAPSDDQPKVGARSRRRRPARRRL